ncbi:sulfotransferase family 2 domain-containing protein [Parahaliea sp. F7430]|uniref:Sulfotransferase family 2 domain-containing protein n=1 Tax=Sediminihaliea albiluteola TaxID=2758564 RepID=A0A7W2YJH1_9GAMM|nr:sulfotransferase family 2 domain-containing protein [Sediminihaliea albiluteola]MBA6412293.1 sulfotransferase family 2 domain-containing protein [Sediminihaliea albiluteola]
MKLSYLNKINAKLNDAYQNKIIYPFTKASNSKRFIFIHIPKAAGTSIRYALGEPEAGRKHLPWWVYKTANPNKYNKYYKFSFIRNPVDRLVSGYTYLRNGGNKQADDMLVANYLRKYKNFESFVEQEILSGFMTNHHIFRPQSWYLCDWSGDIKVDFLGSYENIDEDFKFVADKLGIKSVLPHVNKSIAKLESSFSEDTIGIIEKVYYQDYILIDRL